MSSPMSSVLFELLRIGSCLAPDGRRSCSCLLRHLEAAATRRLRSSTLATYWVGLAAERRCTAVSEAPLRELRAAQWLVKQRLHEAA